MVHTSNAHRLSAVVGLAVLAGAVIASGAQAAGTVPPTDSTQPVVRGLSADEIRALREGEGMGLARAAEWNGNPGPAHVLQAAREGTMHLDGEQRQAIEAVHAGMQAQAQALGRRILDLETVLEQGFRERRMAKTDLAQQVGELGREWAALRLTHLQAHLEMAVLLRPEQIAHYNELRGYSAESPVHHHGQ